VSFVRDARGNLTFTALDRDLRTSERRGWEMNGKEEESPKAEYKEE